MLHWDRPIWPEWPYVGFLAGAIAACVALSGLMAWLATSRRALGWLCGCVAVIWLLANGAAIAVAATPTSPKWALAPIFSLGSFSALWLAWLPAWPIRWHFRLAILVPLVAIAAGFPLVFDTQSVMGDFSPNFVFRFSEPANPSDTEAPQETLDVEHRLQIESTSHDYPQFLGPRRDATAAMVQRLEDGALHDIGLATGWGGQESRLRKREPRELWRQPIGPGWSSFAIVGEYAFTQEQAGPFECITCYRARDGKLMWRHRDQARFVSNEGGDGPRATPTVVEETIGVNKEWRLYAMGATGILNCLNAATGTAVWSVNVLEDNDAQNLVYGITASPLVYDSFVVCSTGKGGPSLVAYDRKTGKRLWAQGTEEPSYGSPLLTEIAGIRQVLLMTSMGVVAHDATTGKGLWSFEWRNSQGINASQPIPHAGGADDKVFISTGYGEGAALLTVQRDQDGAWSVESAWESSRVMNTRFTTPVILEPPLSHGPLVFGLDEGILECVELKTGKKLWKDGRFGYGQILSCGDLLIVQEEKGPVRLVRASIAGLREHGQLECLSDKTWNNPALAGQYLLIRNDREAACYELPLEKE
jgi:outer membrane protein assembly factor BamB